MKLASWRRRYRASLAVAAGLVLYGCTSTQVKLDHRELRTVLMDYQDAQILDNLIRAYNGLPIMQFDFSHVSAAVTTKMTGTANGGQTLTNGSSHSITNTFGNTGTQTLSGAGVTTGIVNGLTGTLSTVAGVTSAAVRPFSFSITPDRENVIGVEVMPVLDHNKVYAAYVRFLKAQDDSHRGKSDFLNSDTVSTTTKTTAEDKTRAIEHDKADVATKQAALNMAANALQSRKDLSEADAQKALLAVGQTDLEATQALPDTDPKKAEKMKAAKDKMEVLTALTSKDAKARYVDALRPAFVAATAALRTSQDTLAKDAVAPLADSALKANKDGTTTTITSTNLDMDLSAEYSGAHGITSLKKDKKKPEQSDVLLGPRLYNGLYYWVPSNYKGALFELSLATVARGNASGTATKSQGQKSLDQLNTQQYFQQLLKSE